MKVRKYISYIMMMGVLLANSSCSQEELALECPEQPQVVGDTFTITGSLDVPDIVAAGTRALGETPGSNLKLTLLEFTKGTDATNSYIRNVYQALLIDATNTTGQVRFTVTLNSTNEPRILHLMLSREYVSVVNFGSEASLLPTIVTNDEAYWNRLEFDNGFVTTTNADGSETLDASVVTKLTNVPMIRNFAKITVEEKDDNFELFGFKLVSVPTSGTIAPFNMGEMTIPQLLGSNDHMIEYSDASQIYKGIMPGNVGFSNSETTVRGINNFQHGSNTANVLWSRSAQYIFEHPFNSLNYTYMIVQGRYYGSGVSNPDTRIDYYKIDLGETNNTDGLFGFYDILRNYNFNVVINSVHSTGAATPSEAIDHPPYNNISSYVETLTMPNVSDGENMLFVNKTSFVFTNQEPQTFLYRYLTNIHGTNPTASNNAVQISEGLKTGSVINSYTQTTYTDESGTEWVAIKITPNEPTAQYQSQSFTVFDGNGLGRTINLVLHTPWTMSNGNVYAGSYNQRPGTITQNVVSNASGQDFTVYFDLPDGLGEEMFPLQFQLEANPQDMENNPIGTLVVSTGPSLFTANNGAPAISYIKTVSWKEYNYLYSSEGSNEVGTSSNTNHTVRCRFRTINACTSGQQTQVIIHNPYFYDLTVSFTRR